MLRVFLISFVGSAPLLASCASPGLDVDQMTAAQLVDPAVAVAEPPSGEYRIGVGDKLNVEVFQVEDLSFEELVVDASGNISLPLVGSVLGAGRTADEIASSIAASLGQQYLRNPHVTVAVAESAGQKITVDGAVNKPGVFAMRGSTSLLQAVAMAEGPSRVADLSQVAVFRTVDGRRAVAIFDLTAIRQGRAPDPQVRGDDVIVVDTSRLNAALREALGALPAFAAFAYF